jgi:hypothetical protein
VREVAHDRVWLERRRMDRDKLPSRRRLEPNRRDVINAPSPSLRDACPLDRSNARIAPAVAELALHDHRVALGHANEHLSGLRPRVVIEPPCSGASLDLRLNAPLRYRHAVFRAMPSSPAIRLAAQPRNLPEISRSRIRHRASAGEMRCVPVLDSDYIGRMGGVLDIVQEPGGFCQTGARPDELSAAQKR